MNKSTRHPLVADYQVEERRVIIVSVLLLMIVALPEYRDGGVVSNVMNGFAEWLGQAFPQIDLIAATRDNPDRTRIVISLVLAMMPFQMTYFLRTMPKKVLKEKLSLPQICGRVGKACVGLVIVLAAFFIFWYEILPSPGNDSHGAIAERLLPILNVDFFSGLLLLLASGGLAHISSAFLVFLVLLFNATLMQ